MRPSNSSPPARQWSCSPKATPPSTPAPESPASPSPASSQPSSRSPGGATTAAPPSTTSSTPVATPPAPAPTADQAPPGDQTERAKAVHALQTLVPAQLLATAAGRTHITGPWGPRIAPAGPQSEPRRFGNGAPYHRAAGYAPGREPVGH